MANIDEELRIIRDEGRGEDVRAAIVSAIKKIVVEREYPPTTLKVNSNGTKEGGPWNKVIVEVDGGVDKMNVDSCTGDITENDYYDIKKLKKLGLIDNPNSIGTDGFTVNVPQRKGEYGEINITENGVYDPLLDGFDGYSKVYVNVLGGDIKDNYTVRFFDGTRMLEAKSVPRGTNATYTGSTKLSGAFFTGWNPNPINVSRDMDCYATYAGGGVGPLIDRFSSTITDSWAQIIEKVGAGGRPYPVGSTKTLTITVPGGATLVLNMMLIGYNVDVDEHGKYVSTWTNINWDIEMSNDANYVFGKITKAAQLASAEITQCHGNTIWWGNCLLRALLNGDPSQIAFDTDPGNDDLSYYNANAAANILLPGLLDIAAGTSLFSKIKKVTKYSVWYNIDASGNAMNLRDQITQDKIWLPSTRELIYPWYNTSSVTPIYAPLPNYMCSKGSAEAGGANQYGNPSILSNVLVGLSASASIAFRTRDNVNNGGSQGLKSANVTNRISTIGYGIFNPSGSWGVDHVTAINTALPISFCL